jgi:multiple antibiotic resistance protein
MENAEPVASTLGILFGLLFTLVGPIKAMPTFHAMTADMAPKARNLLALKGAALGALGIAVASLMGMALITKYGVSHGALAAAAGLVLVIVGLMPLIGINLKGPGGGAPPDALSLAFPTLLPPYAFGLILLFGIYLPSTEGKTGIILVGAVIMAMNAVAMMLAAPIMKVIGMTPLRIFGAVFGILQLGLGVQMMFWGIANGLPRA